jgi:hypothetical protein
LENLKKIKETKLEAARRELNEVSVKQSSQKIIIKYIEEACNEFESVVEKRLDEINADAVNLKNRIVVKALKDLALEFESMMLK